MNRSHSTFLLTTACALLVASVQAYALSATQAPVVAPAEPSPAVRNRVCAAIGVALPVIGANEVAYAKAIEQALGTKVTDEDRKYTAQMEELAAAATKLGKLLVDRYPNVPAPVLTDAAKKMSWEGALAEAKKCLS